MMSSKVEAPLYFLVTSNIYCLILTLALTVTTFLSISTLYAQENTPNNAEVLEDEELDEQVKVLSDEEVGVIRSELSTVCEGDVEKAESKDENSGFASFFHSVSNSLNGYFVTPRGEVLPTLKEYLKNPNKEKFFVKRAHRKSSDLSVLKDGYLDDEISKNSAPLKTMEGPSFRGQPLPIYKIILNDIRRNNFIIKDQHGEIYNNVLDRHENEMTDEEMFMHIFHKIVNSFIKNIHENNIKLVAKGKAPVVIDIDQINNFTHKAIASRAQTFDAESLEKIISMKKDKFFQPSVGVKKRHSYFKIKNNKIIAHTITRYVLKYLDMEGTSDLHGKEIGDVVIKRRLVFDPVNNKISQEQFTVKPIIK